MLHKTEGGYERHLVYFIIQRCKCFSITKYLLFGERNYIHGREFMIEKQSFLQVSHCWLNVRPHYHDWFRSSNVEKEGLVFE